ncbi:MAG: NAD(P)H-dependent flavin oxidoreductase [Novosphingobium sp.]
MALPSRLRDNLTLPVFCAPMFLCSSPALAAECMKSGIVGSLTANHCRDLAEFETHLSLVSTDVARFSEANPGRTIGPLAANVAPTLEEGAFAEHLKACERHGVSIVVTSVGNPTAVGPIVKDFGMLHFHDVTNIRFAEKAAAAGVDGMVAIGAGGGGHSGAISHLAFVPKIREMFDGVVVMAGAVTTGGAIRAAEILGADLAYMGTRFIATKEAGAPDAYKAMLVEGGIEDTIYTRGVNGMPAMWLKASLREAGLDPDNLFIPEGRSTEHLPAGKTPWRDIWSGGQGIGLIRDLPATRDLVRTLREEYIAACGIPDMADAARKAQASGA